MLVDIILVVVGVAWVLAATLFDIKTKEVPDWLSFSFIAMGLGVRSIYSAVSSDVYFLLYGLGGLAVAFAIGGAFYYSHIWGGGDSKLLFGLGVIFATAPFFVRSSVPFLAVLVVNILVFGALYGMIWSSVLLIKNFKVVMARARKLFHATLNLRYIMIACAVVALLLTVTVEDRLTRVMLIVLSASSILYYLLFILIKAVEQTAMCKVTPVSGLRIGDWIAEPVRVNRKIVVGPKDYGLTQDKIDFLKKHKVKNVVVKEGMAFVPAFFFGLAFSLVFGDIIFMLL